MNAIPNNLSSLSLTINDSCVTSCDNITNLGVIFNCKMDMSPYVHQLCKSLYFQLKKISNIRSYLSNEVTKTLVSTLILSKLDYCNSLLAGAPHETLQQLQKVQNHSARLICKKKKSCHITPLLFDLHWLPVEYRINYKLCSIVYKCLHGSAPDYLSNRLNLYSPARTLRSSNDKTVLKKPQRNYKSSGCRSFSHTGPHCWNQLPKEIREATSLCTFKKHLKQHFFLLAYF